MSALHVASLIFSAIAVIFIGVALAVDHGFFFVVAASVALSAYLDHMAIKKSFRDFLAWRGRP